MDSSTTTLPQAIGIDVSKGHLDVMAHGATKVSRFTNNDEGIAQMVAMVADLLCTCLRLVPFYPSNFTPTPPRGERQKALVLFACPPFVQA